MKEIPHAHRSTELVDCLVALWDRSVAATHVFLNPPEIAAIREYVPGAIAEVPTLIMEFNKAGRAIGVMGIAGTELEMLFVNPTHFGQGIGKALTSHGITTLEVREVTVNEQNPAACGFYEHMGFSMTGRSELNEQGNPYPILTMTYA